MGSGTSSAAKERQSWPVRIYRLGAEPGDDLSGTTTAEDRLAMMWPLALDAWTLAGLPLPRYARNETPVALQPWPVPSGREPAR